MASLDAAALHRNALIVDGLTFFGDGDPAPLRAAGIAAVNMTVSHFEADFPTSLDQMAAWLERMRAADAGWRPILTGGDFAAARRDGQVGLIMGWQNARAIEDKLERLALVHGAGLRILQLTYNQRNFLGDGCLEAENAALSALGVRAVGLMNELGIAVDLSHVGERSTLKAAEVSRRPVLATHANARAVTPALRNKSDDALRAIAATGGVIGVSIYGPMCWDGDPKRAPSLGDFLRHLDHVVNLVGIDHVGLGTDLPVVRDLATVASITAMTLTRSPGAIAAYAAAFGNDIRARYLGDCASHGDLGRLTKTLVDRGWREADIRALLGGNWVRVLSTIWGN